MNEKERITFRILVAKCGLDGHDRGARTVALALKNAGIEVIYTGLHQTPEKIVTAALQEDVDAIGVSILSGAHMHVFPKILRLMQEKGLKDVLLFGGGVIPPNDAATLESQGIGKIFPPGASIPDIIRYIDRELGGRRKGAGPKNE
ncbi:MAG: methylmalonyl-CoA mutase [Deltaproteobacteria bacterium]|nr:methylmalonyl-CoA mutase [Deltaproteobacteria bacterium]